MIFSIVEVGEVGEFMDSRIGYPKFQSNALNTGDGNGPDLLRDN
jgi:hypothetical protein